MILEVEKGGLNILAKTPSLLHKIANEIIWNNKLLCINKKSVYFISTEENLNPEQESFPWLEPHVVLKRAKCFALSAEGMIAQVLFVLEARTLNLKQV
ncbi:hypothetical protein pdam_00015746 [Pocillopora damicornis]|uniref:Uncharacterized protein n=1 Tax=Pocillopora damicornis TaxID=46731 RepID=A0A3M6UVG0_POCDA|nr:hypothetical protein pdam_00015746 [Pocillopora damicornis]